MKGVGRQKIINAIDNDIKLIKHGAAKFYLYTPNGICDYRHNTFSTKEPEMLEWIDEYGGGVFFDVGASIGIYSLYYTATQQGSVYSFEPSPFNLRQLVKNICKWHYMVLLDYHCSYLLKRILRGPKECLLMQII